MTIAFVFVALLLLLGVVLRGSLPLFRWLYIPASVIAGILGLAVIQLGLVFDESHVAVWTNSVSTTLSGWPGWLIAVVFAGMLLEHKPASAKESANRVARQGLMVWVIVLGETAVGLLAVWLLIQPFYDVPNSIGMLIETGFAGGHGTAAAMGEVFAHPAIALVGGKDLGMLMATFGLVYGIVTGIFWINIGVRNGWVSNRQTSDGPGNERTKETISHARFKSESVDPMLFQVIWLALAFGFGMLVKYAVMQTATYVDGWMLTSAGLDEAQKQLSDRLSLTNIVDFPLFVYTLFGGLFVRRILSAFGQTDRIDNETIGVLTSSAMDILVVAAIASLNLSAVVAMAVPFSILFICGAVWTAICLLYISRWLLPHQYWFQLGLINYGMSTGTTATGFILLKMVDPELESGAAEDYAMAAPLSAPFIGGGMITIALPLLLLERVPVAIPAITITLFVVGLVFVGRRLSKKSSD